jgi:hypothetical protein
MIAELRRWWRDRCLAHPLAIAWRLLWAPLYLAALAVASLVRGIAFGPAAAVDLWVENRGW